MDEIVQRTEPQNDQTIGNFLAFHSTGRSAESFQFENRASVGRLCSPPPEDLVWKSPGQIQNLDPICEALSGGVFHDGAFSLKRRSGTNG
jgi:cysteine sulfinate desulfinase/cysteine desulfurase-like protein